ncbi:Hypothetical_protein [Hexamita inflata]|uniref:Hypothetical_protein n=1 Tax=Hexamita inflata TaxID=28002 RepID=A0AA86R2X4_9EUKA|nr:Hypothetical protein HINF_LOCUS58339 [Hexamita inflata]
MCQNCCKALCVKVSYTVLIAVVFAVGLFFSFDVYAQSLMFQSNKFENEIPVPGLGCPTEATIKTPLFRIPIGEGYYNAGSQCFSATRNLAETFFNYKNGESTSVYINTTENGAFIMKSVPVTCVSTEFVNDNDSNATVYTVSAVCSWGGLALGIMLLLCIWFCCNDWCRCCCCRPKDNARIYA